ADCRRRDRAHAAGEQQRLLPRQRAIVARLGARRRAPARVRAHAHRHAPAPPGVPPPHLSEARRRHLAHATRRADDRGRMAGAPAPRALGRLLLGRRLAERDERGAPIEDDDLLLLVNAGAETIDFSLPAGGWHLLLDTAAPGSGVSDPYPLRPRALALLAKR